MVGEKEFTAVVIKWNLICFGIWENSVDYRDNRSKEIIAPYPQKNGPDTR